MSASALAPMPGELRTERLLLRPHRLADRAALAAMWADPAVVRHIGGRAATPEESWQRLLRYAGHWALAGHGLLAIERLEDGRFLGDAGLADFRRGLGEDFDGRPEIGWVLVAEAHGQGYAAEATRAVLAWADAALPAAETVCLIDEENAPSLRLAGRMGYVAFDTRRYHDKPVRLLRRSRGG